ncbi:hypothetical protein OA92_23885 [Marinomonas sp. SBI22]|uniref:hypothetical protein n=1 Tax=unclassified Marinomonas TaxID=196814 RepID=UPI0007AF0AEA|nr:MULTISPECIES: hypothetical protein [unclassified Marinomonas]KZM38032.1 hypothetical protein OA92_23885 [Marinomonas sp. SBI22]KZM38034.1 hypothetical protein OA91_23835 [Marinomonas sp. SBI8L]
MKSDIADGSLALLSDQWGRYQDYSLKISKSLITDQAFFCLKFIERHIISRLSLVSMALQGNAGTVPISVSTSR